MGASLSERWILPILKFGRSREQHVADSSTHSLYLIKLFSSSDPEGNKLSGMSRFARQYRPETPRKCALVKHSSPSLGSWHVCSYSVCGVCVCVRCVGMCTVWVCALWGVRCVVAVLLVCLVVCVGVRRCVWLCVWKITVNIFILMCMSVSLFCSCSLDKKTQSGTLTFHDVCFSKPFTFHNGFNVFSSRCCFQHFSRLQKKKWSLKSRKCLKQLREAKKKKRNHCGRSKASKSRHHGK